MSYVYEDVASTANVKEGLIFPDYMPRRVFHPSKMQLNLQDVDLDSGRSASGKMIRHRKGVKRSLSLTFPPMTTDEMSAVLHAVSTFGTIGVSSGTESFFRVTYTDPRANDADENYRVTRWFYAGDRAAPCYSETLGLWEEMSVDLIER